MLLGLMCIMRWVATGMNLGEDRDVHRGGAEVAEQMTGAFDGNSCELHLSSDPGAEVSGGDSGAV